MNPDFTATLFNRLSALNLEPRVIMTVRNQPQLFNSAFGQLIKAFRLLGTLHEFIASHETNAPSFNMRIADAVSAHGAPLTVLRHDSEIILSFLAAIGAPSPAQTPATSERINQSAGPFTIEVARTVHRTLPQLTRPESNECSLILKRVLQDTGLADTGYCGLTTQAAREIEKTFADYNNAFATRVWGCQWAEVFGPDIGQDFQPNDYQMTGVPPGKETALDQLTIEVKRQCEHMLERRPEVQQRRAYRTRRAAMNP